MSLKVMCAGCSVEERERAESDVRRALGARAAGGETWIVSVINLQSRWSVTLDGPGIRALNCTAPPGRLAEAIQEALQGRTGAPPAAATPSRAASPPTRAPAPAAAAPAPPRPASPPTPAPSSTPSAGNSGTAGARSVLSPASGPRRDGHECAQCHQRFAVTFEAISGEIEHLTPVACPHCWHMNRVLVGETAADTSDYRAEKD
jgi:DNA-directed RNA polymerase subunit RPC12/RpoP